MAFLKALFRRPLMYDDLLKSADRLITAPPLPADWKRLTAAWVGKNGISLLDYWRDYYKSQLEVVAAEATWQLQKSRLLKLVMAERSWRAAYVASQGAKHVASWSFMCEGADWAKGADEHRLSSLLSQRWLIAILSDACLIDVGMKSYGLDRTKDLELELHYLLHKEIKSLDVRVMEAMLNAAEEYRDDDAHFIAAFKDDHLAPLIREQYTLLAQMEEDVVNGTVDIPWFNSQLNVVKQKQDELARLVSTN
ncbi:MULTISPECIES: hypothetical protein [Bradyrhizobium]|uniref:hypothetical protein n=1 Tax=Bradyrhizobium TaxID=374 RepID=UPI0012F4E7E7|nr:hypothetical protein [Bradyrhizobium sp. CCBAU 15544]